MSSLEHHLDSIDQYERRDSIILSGNVMPSEIEGENPVQVVVDTIKSHLNVPISSDDINVAHRLGRARQGQSRPMIVKLMSRNKKSTDHTCSTLLA